MGIASKENEPRAKATQKATQPAMAQRTLLSFFKPPPAANVPKEQKPSIKPEQTKRVAVEESQVAQKIPNSPSKMRPTAPNDRPKTSRSSPTPGAQDSMDIDSLSVDNDDELFGPSKRSVSLLYLL
jgi:hypothetical protein